MKKAYMGSAQSMAAAPMSWSMFDWSISGVFMLWLGLPSFKIKKRLKKIRQIARLPGNPVLMGIPEELCDRFYDRYAPLLRPLCPSLTTAMSLLPESWDGHPEIGFLDMHLVFLVNKPGGNNFGSDQFIEGQAELAAVIR